MNAGEMIARLQELDPETPIRYSYWDDYAPGDPEVVETVDCISDRGWLNESDTYELQNEFIKESSEAYGFSESFSAEVLESFLAQARELSEHDWGAGRNDEARS